MGCSCSNYPLTPTPSPAADRQPCSPCFPLHKCILYPLLKIHRFPKEESNWNLIAKDLILRPDLTTQKLWWHFCSCPLTLLAHSSVHVSFNKWMTSIVFLAESVTREALKTLLLPKPGPYDSTAMGFSSILLQEPIFVHKAYKLSAIACIVLRYLKTRRNVRCSAREAKGFSTGLEMGPFS